MRKVTAAVLSVMTAFALTACSSGGAAPATTAAPKTEAAKTEEAKTETTAAEAKLDYPTKDITIIVPYDAGGGNDILARLIAKTAMEGKYFNGQNIIVENQPGGGGAIGQAYVANTAEKDGYTLLTFTASVITNPILKDVPFKVEDFKIINCCNQDPAVLIARPDAPFKTFEELVEYAKTNKLLINDSGFGTSSHLRTLDLSQKLEEAGVKLEYESIHVDSGNLQIAELMGGHADIACITAGECADAILEGNVLGLGILAADRFEGLPDVPTFKEMGYDGFIDGADRAIACSAGVPDDVYQYLVTEFDKLCGSEEFISAMKAANMTPANQAPEEYQKFVNYKTELVTGLKDYLLAGE